MCQPPIAESQRIRFKPKLPAGQSSKEKEHQSSKARSHTAAFVHGRKSFARYDQVSAALGRTDQPYSQNTTSNRMSYEFATQRPTKPVLSLNSDADGSTQPSGATYSPLFNERLHEPLDPFLRLSGNISFHDRNLLHHYLLEGPVKFYGMRSGALYCPVRDMTVAMVQTNDMWLQWTLLSAEISALGPDRAGKSVTFFARRARTYRSMNESISNPKTRFSDHTITRLTMAGLIETRLGNTASGRIHMAAVRALARSCSVVHGVPMQVNFATFCNTTRIGLDSFAFPDVAGFESALSDFLDAMAGMQRWTLTSAQLLDTQADDADSEASPSVRRYALARRRVFSPSALIHRFMGPTCYEEVGFERRSHVARLWGLNRILYELRDDLDQCTDFLETLHGYMESTNELSPTDRRASAMDPKPPKLKVTAVNAIFGKVGTIFLAKPSAGDSFWWRIVDAVEILHLLSLSTRARLLTEFSAGLIGSETPEIIRLVTENQLKNIADEIRQAWIAQ